MTKQIAKFEDVVTESQRYLEKFVSFPDPEYSFACALYVVLTHCWPVFDTLPYLAITAATKRSGKTLLMECISEAGANPLNAGSITASAMFRSITELHPTVYVDEAEKLNSEAANSMREALNTGYRRGQTVLRTSGDEVKEFDVFCPKVFALIGDVNDTLRDRSIVITMRRSDAPVRSIYSQRKLAGNQLREKISSIVKDATHDIVDAYVNFSGASFLTDRDEEIWQCLFAICSVFCPTRYDELKRTAVDLATEKTQDSRKFYELREEAETAANNLEYAERVLIDLIHVFGKDKRIKSDEAITRLHAIDVAPWRKYKGTGLTVDHLAALLDVFGIGPKVMQFGNGRANRKLARGYDKSQLSEIAKREKLV